jgi:hypothetical protein
MLSRLMARRFPVMRIEALRRILQTRREALKPVNRPSVLIALRRAPTPHF